MLGFVLLGLDSKYIYIFYFLSCHENIGSVRDEIILGLHEYIHFSCGSPCTQLEPTAIPWEGDEEPQEMKGAPGPRCVWTAAQGVWGTWVIPEAQVPREIIAIP